MGMVNHCALAVSITSPERRRRASFAVAMLHVVPPETGPARMGGIANLKSGQARKVHGFG